MEMDNKTSPSKPMVFDASLFSAGLNGWQFHYWMPDGRKACFEQKLGAGYLGDWGLEMYADGRGDDGIFFFQKQYPVNSFSGSVYLSWSFARFDSQAPIGAWPRVVYVGPVKDLANPESQHDFTWLAETDQMVPIPGPGEWNTQYYTTVTKASDVIQVCIGWKINWETERVNYIDRIVVLTS